MAMGTGRGGCYTANLQHHSNGGEAYFSGEWVTAFENVHGGTIHMGRYQGHTSMSWDLLPYCEELKIFLEETAGPIAIGITDVNGASMTANITAIWPKPLSNNSSPDYDRIAFYVSGTEGYPDQTLTTILGDGPAMLCLPHLPGEGEEEESSGDGKPPSGDGGPSTGGGGSESDEGRDGSGSSNNGGNGSVVEYTSDIRTLDDIIPSTPLTYNGDDSIITLDLRLVTYKPSALAEILNPKFKSY